MPVHPLYYRCCRRCALQVCLLSIHCCTKHPFKPLPTFAGASASHTCSIAMDIAEATGSACLSYRAHSLQSAMKLAFLQALKPVLRCWAATRQRHNDRGLVLARLKSVEGDCRSFLRLFSGMVCFILYILPPPLYARVIRRWCVCIYGCIVMYLCYCRAHLHGP